MAFPTGRPCLWLLIIQSLYSNFVTSIFVSFKLVAPKNFWMDPTCIHKGFTPSMAQESLDIAGHGARRLVNLNDNYQAWVFDLLFKDVRDFRLLSNGWTEAWNVVGKHKHISAVLSL